MRVEQEPCNADQLDPDKPAEQVTCQVVAVSELLLDPTDITILAGSNAANSGTTDLTILGTSGVWAAGDDAGGQTIGDGYISTVLLSTTSVSLSASATITAQSGVVITWASFW